MSREARYKRRCILTCGGYAVSTDLNMTEALKQLQVLMILASSGFEVKESVIDLCRISCSGAVKEKIVKACMKKDGLFLVREGTGQKEDAQRPHPDEENKTQLTELVIASCGSRLFYLIDQKPEQFKLLGRDDAVREVQDFWKSKKEAKK